MAQRLEIEVGLNKDAALDSARRLRGDLKSVNDQIANDAKAAVASETALHRQARDDRGRFLKQSAEASEAAYKKMGDSGKASFASMATAAGMALTTINQLSASMRVYSDILDGVRRKESERARGALGGLEQQRELAALLGATPNREFGRNMARERRVTLQTSAEQLAFSKNLADGGAQYVGRNLTEAQADEARKRVSALAVAKGIDAGAAGNLLGKIFGARDWRDRPAADIVTEFGASAAQLSAGSGDASHLAGETAKVMAALSSDDTMRGRIRGPAAAARMVSLMAESNPGEEATATRALARGLFDFNDPKSSRLLKSAGIGQTDDLETALQKVKPIIEGQARQRGVPVQAIVGESFADEQVRTALTGALGGIDRGVLAQRRGVEADARRAGSVDATLADFRGSLLGANRVQATREETDETARGLGAAPLEILEQRARTRLKPFLESAGNSFLNTAIKAGSFGAIDPERQVVDRAIFKDLMKSAPDDVRQQFQGAEIPTDPKMRQRFFGQIMKGMEAGGVDPLSAGDEQLVELRKQTAALERLAGGQAPPRPLAEAPPVPRR